MSTKPSRGHHPPAPLSLIFRRAFPITFSFVPSVLGLEMNSPARLINRFSPTPHWNSAISSKVGSGSVQEALLLFRQMVQSSIRPDHLTFPFVLKACSRLATLHNSEMVHAHVVKSPFSGDVFVQTTMIDAYVKCSRLDLAEQLFEEMTDRDVAAWNVIVGGFVLEGLVGKVSNGFKRMRLEGVEPDSLTIISLAQSSSYVNQLHAVRSVHCLAIRLGVDDDVSVANTLMASYSKCDDLLSAKSIFGGISENSRTVVSWNSMIGGFSYLERAADAFHYFSQMCKGVVRPDLSTFLSFISSCSKPEVLFLGKQIHSYVLKIGFASYIPVINTLISMYSKCGDFSSSCHMFDNMKERTCVTWTAIISGYAREGNIDAALNMFRAMETSYEKPDEVTIAALLSACSHSGALDVGRWLHVYVKDRGFEQNDMVCNALVDMYAKCGSLLEARETFDSMHGKTVVSWTAMIAGYGMNGNSKEALALFLQMVDWGACPNELTFLAVLQACTHAGFLKEGRKYFDLMKNVYSLSPDLEHYSCIVDLLGRKGKLKEALEFIEYMPIRPDSGIWGSLLGACKLHQNVEIAEYVAHRLFDLDPNNATPYIAMANIYAAGERWDSVAKIRGMMRSKAVQKAPGQSLVRINGQNHIFCAEDRSHPESTILYEVVENLSLLFETTMVTSGWE